MPNIKTINNKMEQPIHRIIQDKDYYVEEFYTYDNRDRLINRTVKNEKGQIVSEEVREVLYDSLGHIERKVVFLSTYVDVIPQQVYKSQNVYNYFYTYDKNNLLLNKCCKHDNKIVYNNKYFYENNQLIKVEKFDKEGSLKCYECYKYSKNKCTVTAYINNGIVLHTYIYDLSDGQIINRKLVSPSNSKFKWIINYMDDICLEINVYEDQLTPEVLIEITDHIIKYIEIETVIININHTDVDTYQTELWQISNKVLLKYNIRILFDM